MSKNTTTNDFTFRGFDLLIVGRAERVPCVIAQCRATGQRFAAERECTVAALLAELAEFIDRTDSALWRRSGVPWGDLAIADDRACRRWVMCPARIRQVVCTKNANGKGDA
jgi:hypothetical protein